MLCKKVYQHEAIHLKVGDEMITEKEALANVFAGYFTEVQSPNETLDMLVQEYLNSNHLSISAIFKENWTVKEFQLRKVDPAEILS